MVFRRRPRWRKVNIWGELSCQICGDMVHDRRGADLHDDYYHSDDEDDETENAQEMTRRMT